MDTTYAYHAHYVNSAEGTDATDWDTIPVGT